MSVNNATLALLAGLAVAVGPGAHAVSLNPNGGGQALIIPHYTTHGGNDTLLSVTNNSDQGRAVKLRVHESRLGRVVQDMNLYLGPNDTWTAALTDGVSFAVDGAVLLINDSSCMVLSGADNQLMTALPDGRRLLPLRNPGETGIPDDTGPQGAARARYGSIEIIEMAVIEPDTPTADRLRLIDGEPADCAAITAAWRVPDGEWNASPALDLAEPSGTGALTALGMIVEPARGSLFEVPVEALVGFNHQILHTAPGNVEPTLASVNDADNPDQATAVVVADDGRVLTATYADDLASGYGKIDAVSALFAATSISNDFFLPTSDSALYVQSEWALHFPTRRFYVDTLIDSQTGAQFVSAARAPFPGEAGSAESCPAPTQRLGLDRNGRQLFAYTVREPLTPLEVRRNVFCWQTVSFGFGLQGTPAGPTPILHTPYEFPYVQRAWGAGRLRIGVDMADANSFRLRAPIEGAHFRGVPVTGFFVTAFDNINIEGVPLANYAASFRHHIRQEVVAD